MTEPYVTRGLTIKTGKVLSDVDALAEEAEAGYPVYRWDCTVNFTVRSGELDLDDEAWTALFGHKIRPTPEPGTFRYASYVPSLNSIAAQLVAQSELALLLRPFEDVDYFVHHSSATCVGQVAPE